MSPQPKSSNTPAPAEAPTPEATEAPKSLAEQLLDQAEQLAAEKKAVYERIGDNREALRLLQRTGLGVTPEQSKEIDEFYPKVSRGPTAGNGKTATEAPATEAPATA